MCLFPVFTDSCTPCLGKSPPGQSLISTGPGMWLLSLVSVQACRSLFILHRESQTIRSGANLLPGRRPQTTSQQLEGGQTSAVAMRTLVNTTCRVIPCPGKPPALLILL